MSKSEFDAGGFHQALETVRAARGRNWKQVAEEAGVSASTLTRMSQGKRPDVDSMAALVSWSGLRADDFVRRGAAGAGGGEREPLSLITATLRNDPTLSEDGRDAMIEMITAAYVRLRRR